MREIKFRALTYEGKLIDVWGIQFFTEGSAIVNDEVPAKELMQFTGLKDKNGKEIYEGDIVESEEGIAAVSYDGNGFWCSFEKPRHRSGKYFPAEVDRKVIGNIHENPELLK